MNIVHRGHAKGFTLIEVLVVVAIIALLIAILLPSLARARAQANALVCLTNVRQIGTAGQFYTSDNRQAYLFPFRYPVSLAGSNSTISSPPYWFQYVPYKYLANNIEVGRCPVDEFLDLDPASPATKREPFPNLKGGNSNVLYSYSLNERLPKSGTPIYGASPLAGDSLPSATSLPLYVIDRYNPGVLSYIKDPSRLFFLGETGTGGFLNGSVQRINYRTDHGSPRVYPGMGGKGDSMNVLFADMHGELRNITKLYPGKLTDPTELYPPSPSLWTGYFKVLWFGDATVNDRILK